MRWEQKGVAAELPKAVAAVAAAVSHTSKGGSLVLLQTTLPPLALRNRLEQAHQRAHRLVPGSIQILQIPSRARARQILQNQRKVEVQVRRVLVPYSQTELEQDLCFQIVHRWVRGTRILQSPLRVRERQTLQSR